MINGQKVFLQVISVTAEPAVAIVGMPRQLFIYLAA